MVILLVLGFATREGILAQEQEVETEETPVLREDPLREATSNELRQLAETPLPSLEASADILAQAFSSIEEIPLDVVEQGAFKFRRSRIRLTSKAREAEGTPFRLYEDFEASPELYWGQPIALHGYLKTLNAISLAGDEAEQTWHEGQLKLWNDDQTVRFVTNRIPQGLPKGENLNEPLSIIGYLFSTASEDGSPEPLVVVRFMRWMQPTLNLKTLANVKDRRIGLTDEEYQAMYRTLLHAKLVDEKILRKVSEDFWANRQDQLKRPRPLFVDLFKSFEDDPSLYRGKPVTLTGTLRKLKRIASPPTNDFGIETEYEGWIFDEDSQSNPTFVVFTENPDDLPLGDDLNVPVRVTGFVFKMYGYESRDKDHPLRVAPMLIAKSVKKLIVIDPNPFPIAWVGGALALLFLGLVMYAWFSSRQDKEFRQITQKVEDEEPPRFDNLTIDGQ